MEEKEQKNDPLSEKDEELEMNTLDLSQTDTEEKDFLDRFGSGAVPSDIASPSFDSDSEEEFVDLTDLVAL